MACSFVPGPPIGPSSIRHARHARIDTARPAIFPAPAVRHDHARDHRRTPRSGRAAHRRRVPPPDRGPSPLRGDAPAGAGEHAERCADELDGQWAGAFPLHVAEAPGRPVRVTSTASSTSTSASATPARWPGTRPPADGRRRQRQVARGITTMLPTEDAVVVGEELSRRFGLPQWQFTLTATDANRHALRYARHLTGRPQGPGASTTATTAASTRRSRRWTTAGGPWPAPRQHRAAGRSRGDDGGGRVQRPRRRWSERWRSGDVAVRARRAGA